VIFYSGKVVGLGRRLISLFISGRGEGGGGREKTLSDYFGQEGDFSVSGGGEGKGKEGGKRIYF